MSTDYESATPTTTGSGTSSSGAGGTWRDRVRSDVSTMSYADGAAALSPAAAGSPTVQLKKPDVHETATEKLGEIEGSDHDTRSLCYMENANKVSMILEAYKAKLAEHDKADGDDADASAELALLGRMIAFLEYAKTFVDSVNLRGSKKKDAEKKLDELAAEAFPDLAAAEAGAATKALYYLSSTQPSQIRKMPTPLRGAGVGGALASMGGASVLYQDEMAAGKLKPGAPLQMWWGGRYRLTHQKEGESTDLSAKQVYHYIMKGKIHHSEGIWGHSVTFVKYDDTDKSKIYYMEQGGNTLSEMTIPSSGTYLVGANLDTSGDSVKTAEYVLKDTAFKADIGKINLASRANRYKLDASKMTPLLIAGINASGHADLTTIQAAVTHLGTPSAFDHDMARLVGLWQHAVGISCDGDFGDGSSTTLVGTRLEDATAIQTTA